MCKISLDKYYSSPEVAEHVANKTKEIIGDKITEYIEPAAGAGIFLDYLDKPYLAFDIEPHDKRIVKEDYLKLDIEYKQGRCVIGNPPYGSKLNLAAAFYNKSIGIADYIAFILPISQYKNNIKLYRFNLIYSEDLGVKEYSGKKVHCCLNIYTRGKNGLNKRHNYKLKDVSITEVRLNNKFVTGYDIRIKAWGGDPNVKRSGNNLIGCEVDYPGQYAKEFCITVHNIKYKDRVLNLIRNANWREIYQMTATPNLLQWQIYKYIKEQIPDIE